MLDQGTLSTGVLSNTNDDSESSFLLIIRAERGGCERMILKNESYLLMEGIPQEIAANLFFYETGCLLFNQSQCSKASMRSRMPIRRYLGR